MPEKPFDFSQLAPGADKKGGVWATVVLTIGGRRIKTGAEFLIAYSRNNDELLTRSMHLIGKLQRAANGQPVNQVLIGKATKKAQVGPVLKNWRGFQEGGKEVSFSQAAAEAALLKYQELFEFVTNFADNPDNFDVAPGDETSEEGDDEDADPDTESEGDTSHAALKSGGSLE